MKSIGVVAFALVILSLGAAAGYVLALNGPTYDIISIGNNSAFVLNRWNGALRLCSPTKCSAVPVDSR